MSLIFLFLWGLFCVFRWPMCAVLKWIPCFSQLQLCRTAVSGAVCGLRRGQSSSLGGRGLCPQTQMALRGRSRHFLFLYPPTLHTNKTPSSVSTALWGGWLAYGFSSVYKKIRIYGEAMRTNNLMSETMQETELDDTDIPGVNWGLKNNW